MNRHVPLAFPGMRIGLFGGTFNPAHEGHAHIAETALKRLRLHKVWWLVSPQNPLKAKTRALKQRVASARKFARGRAMAVCDFEARLKARYTIETVSLLQRAFPRVRFVWVMGADNFASFHRWRRWRAIFTVLPIAVISRPGAGPKGRFSRAFAHFAAKRRPAESASRLADTKTPAWTYLPARDLAVSSTRLRKRKG